MFHSYERWLSMLVMLILPLSLWVDLKVYLLEQPDQGFALGGGESIGGSSL